MSTILRSVRTLRARVGAVRFARGPLLDRDCRSHAVGVYIVDGYMMIGLGDSAAEAVEAAHANMDSRDRYEARDDYDWDDIGEERAT
jgi:hypothetical protein